MVYLVQRQPSEIKQTPGKLRFRLSESQLLSTCSELPLIDEIGSTQISDELSVKLSDNSINKYHSVRK